MKNYNFGYIYYMIYLNIIYFIMGLFLINTYNNIITSMSILTISVYFIITMKSELQFKYTTSCKRLFLLMKRVIIFIIYFIIFKNNLLQIIFLITIVDIIIKMSLDKSLLEWFYQEEIEFKEENET